MGIVPGCIMDVWATVTAWNSVGAKLTEGIILLHDNTHPHVNHVKLLEVFNLLVHSPNARPCNFLTFGQFKKGLKFTSDDDMHAAAIVVYAAAQVLLLTCVWIGLYLNASGDFFHLQHLHLWTSTNGFQVYMPGILYETSITKPKCSRVHKIQFRNTKGRVQATINICHKDLVLGNNWSIYCFCNVVCIHSLFTLILLHRRKSCLTNHQHTFLVLCNRLSPHIYLTTLRASITRMARNEEWKTDIVYTQSTLKHTQSHTHRLLLMPPPINKARPPTSPVWGVIFVKVHNAQHSFPAKKHLHFYTPTIVLASLNGRL